MCFCVLSFSMPFHSYATSAKIPNTFFQCANIRPQLNSFEYILYTIQIDRIHSYLRRQHNKLLGKCFKSAVFYVRKLSRHQQAVEMFDIRIEWNFQRNAIVFYVRWNGNNGHNETVQSEKKIFVCRRFNVMLKIYVICNWPIRMCISKAMWIYSESIAFKSCMKQ